MAGEHRGTPHGDALLQVVAGAAPHGTTPLATHAANEHDPLGGGFPPGAVGKLLFILALAFSAFQIATAAHIIDLPSQVVRAVHVGFLLVLVFPLMGARRAATAPPLSALVAWVASALAAGIAFYQWTEYSALLLRAGDPNTMDMVVGVALMVLLFSATWRVMGPALADHLGHLSGLLPVRPISCRRR